MFAKHIMFAEYIFEHQLKVDPARVNNTRVISDCFKIQSINQGRQYSNVGGYQSNDLNTNMLTDANCFDLNNLIATIQTNIKKSNAPLNEMELNNIWININNKGDWNSPHSHPQSSLAGVYHVTDTNEQSGQLHILRDNTGAHISCSYSAGTIILFSSHLLHYVSPNKTDTPRVTLSFNMVNTKEY